MEWRHTVWHEPKLVYTAVPKVANTSIKTALLKAYMPDVPRKDVHSSEIPYITARPNRVPKRFPHYVHFTFVRHPFDRVISFWANKIAGVSEPIPPLLRRGFVAGMSLGDAVLRVCDIPDADADPHFRSQSWLLAPNGGGVTAEFVGRFERLEQDWQIIRRLAAAGSGGRKLGRLPRRVVSDHGDWQELLTPELAEKLSQRYRRDLELFSYSSV